MISPKSGGGWAAISYSLRKGRMAGGLWKLWKALRAKNACKTCAVGMGGQQGGMVDELGRFPQVCRKSVQALAADMQGTVPAAFWNTYSLAQLRCFSPRELEACGRITSPLICQRGDGYYRPVTWDEALGRIVASLKAVEPRQTFWYASGRSSNEAGFLLQLFARLYGANHVASCSSYCHQASVVGLAGTLGSGAGTIRLEDLEQADLVFVIGGNPASNHPRLMRSLLRVRRRRGELLVVNPVVETGLVRYRVSGDVRSLLFGSRIASLYVQPHIGGDLALFTGVAKRIDEMRAIDDEFLATCCNGWKNLSLSLRTLAWSDIERKSGVARGLIDEIAQRYAAAKAAVFAWTMGATQHVHGVQNVQAIANLALMRGMVGRPGAGLLPIRGHSNEQGLNSVGVTPKLQEADLDRLEQYFGVELPAASGIDTVSRMDTTSRMDTGAVIEAAATGRLKVGFCLGGNLYGSNPDSTIAAAALGKLDLLVYLSTTLNTGHAHGVAQETIVLPVLARDEEPQPTTQESMFSYVRLSDGGPARHASSPASGPRSEVQVISALAAGVLGGGSPIDWRGMESTSRIRAAIARIVPGYEKLAEIDETRHEFTVGGRVLDEPTFPTPDGRAKLHLHDLPELAGGAGQLRLMTVRSEGQFNTVVYEERDLYRGQDRRNVVLVHPDDIKLLGLAADQRVTVRSEAGLLDGILLRPFERIKPGNALMYYPEANSLVPRRADPQSGTPAFKNVLVTLTPCAQSAAQPPPAGAVPPLPRRKLPGC